MKNELIKVITNTYEEKIVMAKELYLKLGFTKTQWSRWYKKNIVENPFAEEGKDFITFDIMSNGNKTKDFEITIDFAKKICMMARTEKGEEFRRYFIEVEKEYRKLLKARDRKEIIRLAGIEVRKGLTDAIKELIPDTPHKKFAYPNFTKLIYKTLFDSTLKEMRELYNVTDKDNLRDFLDPEELRKVERLESVVKGYIGLGMNYKEIKELLEQFKGKALIKESEKDLEKLDRMYGKQ